METDSNNKVFINCSNHPSERWSREQKQAAEGYGEIVDLPFPEVDPSWDAGQVRSHPKTLMLHIVTVQLCLLRDRQCIPPVNLCPARQPGKHIVSAVPVPLFKKIILIPQGRPGAHNTHLSPNNIQKLRKLIQAALPQKFSGPGNILFRIFQKVCGHILRRIRPHGAELENLKIRFVNSHPLLPEKDRPRRIQL